MPADASCNTFPISSNISDFACKYKERFKESFPEIQIKEIPLRFHRFLPLLLQLLPYSLR